MNQIQYNAPPAAGSTQLVQTVTPVDTNLRPDYRGDAVKGLGITQMVLGAAIFVTQICASVARTTLAPGATGYWMGIFFFVTGLNGILSGRSKRKCQIIVFLVLSTLSSIFAAALVIVAAMSIFFNFFFDGNDCNGCGMNPSAIDGAMVIFAFLELIIAIVSAAFACGGVCCYRQQVNQVGYTQDGQVLIVTNGQGAAGGYQPQMVTATGYQPQVGTSGGYQPQGPPQYDFQEKKTNGIP